jgi:DNA-binding CsgD family transcriptional regulator
MSPKGLPTRAGLLKVLDAMYQVEQPRAAWLGEVLRVSAAVLSHGAGVGGVLYDISSGTRVDTDLIDGVQISEEWLQSGIDAHRDPRFIPAMLQGYRSTLCTTLSEHTGDPMLREVIRSEHRLRHGIQGQILINGGDSSGKGCCLFIFAKRPLALSAAQRGLFNRLATHLATAYRLQRRLEIPASPVEAVLTPAGQVAHAELPASEGWAREELTRAVQQREWARSAPNTNAESAALVWKGLVEARWTLLDREEADGKRFVLARENAPLTVSSRTLSERERQVVALAALGRSNKLIAYELGLAHSTIRVLLARAAAKLGATSRSDLIARVTASDT